MAQRINRAKQRIKTSGIPFRPPTAAEHTDRLNVVLEVLYLIFNEGGLLRGRRPPAAPGIRLDPPRRARARYLRVLQDAHKERPGERRERAQTGSARAGRRRRLACPALRRLGRDESLRHRRRARSNRTGRPRPPVDRRRQTRITLRWENSSPTCPISVTTGPTCAPLATQRIDPLDELGIVPVDPLPYFGWGDLPDQYGRRWDADDGESPEPKRPARILADLPPILPWRGPRRDRR
jgi:hypothetical protein